MNKNIITFIGIIYFINEYEKKRMNREDRKNLQSIKGTDEKIKLNGKITYIGKLPKKKILQMVSDSACAKYWEKNNDVPYSESFQINENNELKNVIVWLEPDSNETLLIKEINSLKKEEKTHYINQEGCIYKPHVNVIMKNQKVIMKNSDKTFHNVHSMSENNKQYNFAMPKTIKEKEITFNRKENKPFYIKCDFHPWMKTWVLVLDHPYYAITDENGNYEIPDIIPGRYKIKVWQEKLSNPSNIILKTNKTIFNDELKMLDKNITMDFEFNKRQKK